MSTFQKVQTLRNYKTTGAKATATGRGQINKETNKEKERQKDIENYNILEHQSS